MRASEEQRFDELVAARYAALRRSAVVLCGDVQHAEDLVQTTFLKVYRRWDRMGDVADVDAYLHTVLVNTSRTWGRRRWHGERPTEVLPEHADPTDGAAAVDLRGALRAALATLSARQREVLVLRHVVGLSEAETAAQLGISPGTVKSSSSRALAALRASGLLDDDPLSSSRVPDPSGTPTRRSTR